MAGLRQGKRSTAIRAGRTVLPAGGFRPTAASRSPVCPRRPVTGVSCEQYCGGGGAASSCGGFLAVAR
eukprot:3172208-Alexandrium_andersonii.AAC.1